MAVVGRSGLRNGSPPVAGLAVDLALALAGVADLQMADADLPVGGIQGVVVAALDRGHGCSLLVMLLYHVMPGLTRVSLGLFDLLVVISEPFSPNHCCQDGCDLP